MFSNRLNSLRRSLAFRLTLWYAGIFALSSCLAFAIFYYLILDVRRLQTDDSLQRQVKAFAGIMQLEGLEGVRRVAELESRLGSERMRLIRLISRFGAEFTNNTASYWQGVGVNSEAIRLLLQTGQPVMETVNAPEHKDSLRIIYGFIAPGVILQLGESLASEIRMIAAFQRLFLATMAAVLGLAAAVGWFLARRALSGIGAIAGAARQISDGDLQSRAPISGRGDEIDQLAATLNHMLDRIQSLIVGIKEMSDSMAHDLKSPITRIRGLAEVTLTADGAMEDYAQMAASTIEECDRLLDMLNAMLFISRAEAGVGDLNPAPLALDGLLSDAVRLFETTAADRGLTLRFIPGPALKVSGDARMLQRMVANLLDNAIRYTPPGGRVEVSLAQARDGRALIRFQDTGCGISPADLPRIFERFYRCDPSRSESGSGLGLSLAQAVARTHGGEIRVASRPGQGSTFEVELPIVTA